MAHRLPRHDHQPGVERRVIDADGVQTFADLEANGLALVLEDAPAAPSARFEARAPKDERPMMGVHEVIFGVDPAVDADVSPATRRGELERLRDAHPGRCGQQSADPVARSERPQDGSTDDQGEHACGSEEKGTHGPDDIRGNGAGTKGPEGTYPRRGH